MRSTSCRSTATCCFKFLNLHFRFLLKFLEQRQLLGLDSLPHQFLGDLLECLFPAAVLQFPKAVLVAFLGRLQFPFQRGVCPTLQHGLHFVFLAAEELFQCLFVLQPVATQSCEPIRPVWPWI